MKRVLVIDDSKVDRLINRRWLENGFEVEEAATVDEGIAAARTTHFDCVLMDYVMPDGDGLHGIHAMRAVVPNCPPIILLTCALTEDMRRNALALGVSACFAKPVMGAEALTEAITTAISEQRTNQEREKP